MGFAALNPSYGSVANRNRPTGLSVLTSKVRISVAPPTSIVTAMRSPAAAVAMMRAPFGSSAVISAGAVVADTAGALPSARKRR